MDSDTDNTTNELLFDDVPEPDTELSDSSPYRERTANLQAALAHLTEEDIEQRISTVVQVMHLLGLNLAVFLDQLLYKNKRIEENGVLVFERTTFLGSHELEDCLDRMHHRPISHESGAEQPKSNQILERASFRIVKRVREREFKNISVHLYLPAKEVTPASVRALDFASLQEKVRTCAPKMWDWYYTSAYTTRQQNRNTQHGPEKVSQH
jgi:hypothetical protein